MGHSKWVTIKERRRQKTALRRLTKVSEEIGKIPVTVCVTHATFVPCRHGGKDNGKCVFSDAMADVSKVFTIQNAIADD